MGFCSANGSLLSCPFGMAPGVLTVLPKMVMGPTGPLGTCMDCIPFLNISPFVMCKSLANPTTAALTASHFGVLTPGPCIPVPAGMWIPIKPNLISTPSPVLDNSSILMCAFGGAIKINMPGQFMVMT